MKIINERIFKGKNIYSHKKSIRIDVDLEGYAEIPTKDIPDFNYNLTKMIPELYKHRCGIDEEHGFVKRLNEGTYLAHVFEHTIIAIQNMLGIDLAYGKAREIAGDRYYIIFQYEYEKTAVAISKLAEQIINSLINRNPIDFKVRLEYIKKLMKQETLGASTKAICEAAKKYGLPILRLGNSNVYQMGYGKCGRIFGATVGHNTRCIATDIACDKELTKNILEAHFIPVAEGRKIYNTINLLKEADLIGYPVVLKPQYGSKGEGVILNIKNKEELLSSYRTLSEQYKDIILEKYIKGDDYRICIVDYKVVAVSLRIPPNVIGDGTKSIKELIRELNSDPRRGEDHENILTKIKIDEVLLNCLKLQGFSIDSIPVNGQVVKLRENANLSTGGCSEDYTSEICEENKDICIRAAKAIGLDICGVDICIDDIRKPLYGNGVVMEVNAAPGIRMHHYPCKGEAHDVADEIVKAMYNGKPKNIPLISVTGTNGKTTTTRFIAYVMKLIGYKVGMTSTGGIYVDGKCIDLGDDTGAESARAILLNPDVDIAVLETARGGMIKRGLAYDEADIGVITNITEDHLGIDGINDLEELSKVKALVVEAVKKDGYAVINADDKWSVHILDRIKARKILFSMKGFSELLRSNVEDGNPVVYLEEGKIIVYNNFKKYILCDEKDVAIGLEGKLKYNIENALAAIAALVGVKVDYCIIVKALKEFSLNEEFNPGRFNQYDLDGVNVVLDYGHNINGYRAVIESVKDMGFNKLIGVIGVPGDRTDSSIIKIGEFCGDRFNSIVIKEDMDKRGRKDNEVAELLRKGVLKKANSKHINVVLDEVEALDFALKNANKGDLIIIFFEDYNRIITYIKKKKSYIESMKKAIES
ncbi:cyanophycin synthetase [Clostridium cavendishii DSM 21758]|uniref:Cyanophycin synthetase n=1 Tax=Clostridium cavendishii DSM 21758 TaxID=1121302 RepID=A0A1M6U6C0_9CLOT|nr:cyanophycin synthetase [Clostridium cavendishii]SHK64737.1 cyanophycin synthetase [Clostridium cavendishii DSM 21758]